jgi:hypothetical protein
MKTTDFNSLSILLEQFENIQSRLFQANEVLNDLGFISCSNTIYFNFDSFTNIFIIEGSSIALINLIINNLETQKSDLLDLIRIRYDLCIEDD